MADEIKTAAEEVKKERPKRGRGGTGNFPNSKERRNEIMKTPEGRASVRKALQETLEAFKQTPVKSDEELCERLAEYFQRCIDREIIPTIEEMWLYCGRCREWADSIYKQVSKGFSPETKLIIKKAREYMAAFDGKIAIDGQVNPIIYFFRAKNYYGMVDKQEIDVAPAAPEQSIDAAAIRARYLGNSANGSLSDGNDFGEENEG